MNKVFINNPFFRLVGPALGGTMVYLLILLFNNNVGQLQDTFLGEELYICIGLFYLIMEAGRLALVLLERLRERYSFFRLILLQIATVLSLNVVLVSLGLSLYYEMVLEFTPTEEELIIFNSMFSFLMMLYLTLYVSNRLLYQQNTSRLNEEELLKESLESDFRQFKRGINPDLLFEGLENLIAKIHYDEDGADEVIDQLSQVYRYILTNQLSELATFEEESGVIVELIQLFNALPNYQASLEIEEGIETLLPPGVLLSTLEQIIRTNISTDRMPLKIRIESDTDDLIISHKLNEKLNLHLDNQVLNDIERLYAIYSNRRFKWYQEEGYQFFHLPKLSTLISIK